MKKKIILLLPIILLLSTFVSATNITACQQNILTDNGNYVVTQDLIDTTQSSCLIITGNNNTIDFQNHSVDTIYTPTFYGIDVSGNNNILKNIRITSSNYTNTIRLDGPKNTIQDSYIKTALGSSIYLKTADNSKIINTIAYTTNDCGQDITIEGSDNIIIDGYNNNERTALGCEERSLLFTGNNYNNTIKNSEFNSGLLTPIVLGNGFSDITNDFIINNNVLQKIKIKSGTSDGSLIYNNHFLNNNPFVTVGGYDTADGIFLNTTIQSQERIYSFGNEISGNFYGGYSEDCIDADINGFCDNSLTSGGATDYNPLTDLPPDFIEPESFDVIGGDTNIIINRNFDGLIDDSLITLAVYEENETDLLNTSNSLLLIEDFAGNETSIGTSGLANDNYILVASRTITGLKAKAVYIIIDQPTEQELLIISRNTLITIVITSMILFILINMFGGVLEGKVSNEKLSYYYGLLNKILIITIIISLITYLLI